MSRHTRIVSTGLVTLALAALSSFAAPHAPIVIAHRGASGYLPEHTLAAKACAHAMGADYLEQDVVLSKDNVPMVLHDVQIDTVTDVAQRFPERKRSNGRYYAIDFTVQELKQLRVLERFDPKTGKAVYPQRFPLGQSQFSISTLEEELQLIQGMNRSTGRVAGIYPELKAPSWHRHEGKDIASIVLPILARYGYKSKEDPIILQCFDFGEVKRVRSELGYKGRQILLIGKYGTGHFNAAGKEATDDNSKLLIPEGLAEIARYADGIGPSITHIADTDKAGGVAIRNVVSLAHAAGLLVHPYTYRKDAAPAWAKSPDAFFELFFGKIGVDGMFTDHPDLAVAFLKKAIR